MINATFNFIKLLSSYFLSRVTEEFLAKRGTLSLSKSERFLLQFMSEDIALCPNEHIFTLRFRILVAHLITRFSDYLTLGTEKSLHDLANTALAPLANSVLPLDLINETRHIVCRKVSHWLATMATSHDDDVVVVNNAQSPSAHDEDTTERAAKSNEPVSLGDIRKNLTKMIKRQRYVNESPDEAYTDEAFYADICAILKRHVPCKHTSCLYEITRHVDLQKEAESELALINHFSSFKKRKLLVHMSDDDDESEKDAAAALAAATDTAAAAPNGDNDNSMGDIQHVEQATSNEQENNDRAACGDEADVAVTSSKSKKAEAKKMRMETGAEPRTPVKSATKMSDATATTSTTAAAPAATALTPPTQYFDAVDDHQSEAMPEESESHNKPKPSGKLPSAADTTTTPLKRTVKLKRLSSKELHMLASQSLSSDDDDAETIIPATLSARRRLNKTRTIDSDTENENNNETSHNNNNNNIECELDFGESNDATSPKKPTRHVSVLLETLKMPEAAQSKKKTEHTKLAPIENKPVSASSASSMSRRRSTRTLNRAAESRTSSECDDDVRSVSSAAEERDEPAAVASSRTVRRAARKAKENVDHFVLNDNDHDDDNDDNDNDDDGGNNDNSDDDDENATTSKTPQNVSRVRARSTPASRLRQKTHEIEDVNFELSSPSVKAGLVIKNIKKRESNESAAGGGGRGDDDNEDDDKKNITRVAGDSKRIRWTEKETIYLVAGIEIHGKGNWAAVLKEYPDKFVDRTNVNLKDRYRNLEKNSELTKFKKMAQVLVRSAQLRAAKD